MEKLELAIDGMSCGHCVAAVKAALEGLDGVRVERVEVGSASVAFDPARVATQRIVDAVEDEGYSARPGAV